MLDALICTGLGLLIAHQLGNTYGRCRLCGEGVEKPPVICGVILLAKPWAKVEQADQLALAYERYGYLHAGSLQSLQCGRVKVQFVDLNRAWGAEKICDDRVVRHNIDRCGHRLVRTIRTLHLNHLGFMPGPTGARQSQALQWCSHRN